MRTYPTRFPLTEGESLNFESIKKMTLNYTRMSGLLREGSSKFKSDIIDRKITVSNKLTEITNKILPVIQCGKDSELLNKYNDLFNRIAALLAAANDNTTSVINALMLMFVHQILQKICETLKQIQCRRLPNSSSTISK